MGDNDVYCCYMSAYDAGRSLADKEKVCHNNFVETRNEF